MKTELEMKLVEKYPNIFQQYGGDMKETCMAWGMSHGDGWYSILDETCGKIQNEIDEFHKENAPAKIEVIAAQVKEKYGTLRFYVDYAYSNIDWKDPIAEEFYKKISRFINEANLKSSKTCEECGKEGTLHKEGWWYTSCKECDPDAVFDEKEENNE